MLFRSIQTIQTEVLVIGGTASGVCAGIQSARLGVNTIIIESSTWLGGMLTSAGVAAFDGNHNMPSGIFGEFRQKLYTHYGGVNAVSTGWVSNTLFEPHIGDSIFKQMASEEKNLKVKYRYQFKEVIKSGNLIVGARFYNVNNNETLIVKAKRIIDATARRMGVDDSKVMINIDRYGNTTNGTIPLCLWEWEKKLHKGDNIVLAAFGGGFTWGAVYLKWAYDSK